MNTEKKSHELSNRNGALDFLRFAASIILVLHHYEQVNNVSIDNGVNFYGGHFYWGFLVDFFFVLSGFFVINSVLKISEGKLTFRDYYLHRCVRLLPLVSFAGILYFLINNYLYYGIMGEYYLFKSTGRELILTFLGMQVSWASLEECYLNPPMWYISSLLIGFVYLYLAVSLTKARKINYVFTLLPMILVSVLGDLFGINLPFFENGARRSIIGIFIGVLLATYLKKHKIKGFHYIFVTLIGIVGAVLCLIALANGKGLLERYALTFLSFPAILILFNSTIVKKVFSAKIWNVLGAASFDTYVLHIICILLIRCANRSWNLGLSFENWWLEYLICIVICGIGLFSYRFAEPNLKKIAEKIVRFI